LPIFDLVLVDAPCSGSGLFRKMPEWADEWNLNLVHECSVRQKKILSDVLPNMKRDSLLVYSTCSFSKEENEDIIDFAKSMADIEILDLNIPANWGITKTHINDAFYGYRFWPDKINGEGFFISVMQVKQQSVNVPKFKSDFKLIKAPDFIKKWTNESVQNNIFQDAGKIYFWNEKLQQLLSQIGNLKFIKRGVLIGEMKGKDLIPAYDFAMSEITSTNIPSMDVSRNDALRYLKKENVLEMYMNLNKDWNRICYQNLPLGWVKVLESRINNYFPSELRILKALDESLR
jgi:NOL1/NOP2/fmu family ribosome biogenesis protein